MFFLVDHLFFQKHQVQLFPWGWGDGVQLLSSMNLGQVSPKSTRPCQLVPFCEIKELASPGPVCMCLDE